MYSYLGTQNTLLAWGCTWFVVEKCHNYKSYILQIYYFSWLRSWSWKLKSTGNNESFCVKTEKSDNFVSAESLKPINTGDEYCLRSLRIWYKTITLLCTRIYGPLQIYWIMIYLENNDLCALKAAIISGTVW